MRNTRLAAVALLAVAGFIGGAPVMANVQFTYTGGSAPVTVVLTSQCGGAELGTIGFVGTTAAGGPAALFYTFPWTPVGLPLQLNVAPVGTALDATGALFGAATFSSAWNCTQAITVGVATDAALANYQTFTFKP